jgi:hypothetical protein
VRSLLALFDKPAAKVGLTASSAAEHAPTSGLVTVSYEIAAKAPLEARLLLFVGDAATPAFEKPLALEAEPTAAWLALHGCLLPDGTTPLRLELRSKKGAPLAARTLKVQTRNGTPVADLVRASLRATGVPLVLDGECDSAAYDYGDDSLTPWFDRSSEAVESHLQALESSGRAEAAEIAALRHFVAEGYLEIADVVAPEHLARLNAALDDAVARKVEGYEWGSSQRMHNLHLDYPAIRELWLHPKILRTLDLIFESPARPCQSLTYVFGSQQEYHQDTIHLTSFPAGRMCGVWTALEDVQPDSGELVVYPGSHRLPRLYMRTANIPKVKDDWSEFGAKAVAAWTDLMGGAFKRKVYRPKAGTVLVWHENLMHGGSMRLDMSQSRRSIVGHYFAEGAVVYYDSSGLPGSLYEGDRA